MAVSGTATVRHRGRRVLGATLAGSIALAGLAFWAGTELHAGSGALPAHVSEPQVSVPVRAQRLVDGVRASGRIALPSGQPVTALRPQVAQPGARPVITSLPWHVGSRLRDGDVLAQVEGRPIFLLAGAIPPYRDLLPAESGPDVAQLQRALRGAGFTVADPAGVFGASTEAAIRALYRSHGFSPPGEGLPVWSAVDVARLPATVASLHAAAGQLLGSRPLLDLTSGAPVAEVGVGPSIPPTLADGMRVRLTTAAGRILTGRVISPGTPADPTVTVALPRGFEPALGSGLSALIERSASSGPVLSVPFSALQAGAGGGDYVQARRRGRWVRVAVAAGMNAGGYVAVKPLAGAVLQAGEAVLIPD